MIAYVWDQQILLTLRIQTRYHCSTSMRYCEVLAVILVLFSGAYGFIDLSYYANVLSNIPIGSVLRAAGMNYFAGTAISTDKSNLVYPGTKWCGAGNIADNYSDLGTNIETDKCCREHDHCSQCIVTKCSAHGLFNNASYSRVHCSCEQKFYDCLNVSASNGDFASQVIGYMYFHMLETQCFKEDYPIVNCTKYPETERCCTYQQNKSAGKTWQWFDVPYFYT